MKAVMRSIAIGILSCFLFGVPGLAGAQSAIPDTHVVAKQDSEPVRKLRALYLSHPEYKKTIAAAFANLQEPPDGSSNPWKGKKFDDLCDFFNEWYALLPVNKNPAADEFLYITKFSWFYYKNKPAQMIVGKEPGLGWTKEFVAARGRFLDSRESTQTIAQWIADPSIQIDQYVVPESGFKSFNQFFTRDLKPGTRSVSEKP